MGIGLTTKRYIWIGWATFMAVLCTWLGGMLIAKPTERDLALLLPNATSHGHHQIEMSCDACHTRWMGVKNDACTQCHGAELKAAADSHPAAKFAGLDKVPLVEKLDARSCLNCHTEHRPERTLAMGLTQPADYCFHCHEDIGENRPNHASFAFDTCATAGCHNFHDNRALNEPYLSAHLDEPWMLATPLLQARTPGLTHQMKVKPGDESNTASAVMASINPQTDAERVAFSQWSGSLHAVSAVGCSDCHAGSVSSDPEWLDAPNHDVCGACHSGETEGFLLGKHGMRLAAGLSPMTPGQALIPMKAAAIADPVHYALSCSSCHGPHNMDTKFAAADACLKCHNDDHTLAWESSPHGKLFRDEVAGAGAAGSGVSCASCHIPRQTIDAGGKRATRVNHNQSDNLRPNEKMIRDVCGRCHGVGFAIDALADAALIANNFSGVPGRHVESLDLIKTKLEEAERRRRLRGE